MGASGSVNSAVNEVLASELRRPLDAADILKSSDPSAARAEVCRLRAQLRYLADKDEFKKRKNDNKWRRGSFGHIDKAETYWDQVERKEGFSNSRKSSNTPSPARKLSNNSSPDFLAGDLSDFERAQKAMNDLNAEVNAMLDDPTTVRKSGVGASENDSGAGDSEGRRDRDKMSLDHRLSGSGGERHHAQHTHKAPTKRRSFVLEKGLTLVDSDSEGEKKGERA